LYSSNICSSESNNNLSKLPIITYKDK
jgi:hypothetical protein